MKIRRLQRNFDPEGWCDDAYAYEDEQGQVVFNYNLTWESMGSNANRKLQETGVSLEEIATVIPEGKGLRWLAVEIIADDEVETYLERLDDACDIPRPQSVAKTVVV